MWDMIRKFFQEQKPVTVKQEELRTLAIAQGNDEYKSRRLDAEPDLRVIAYDILVTMSRNGNQ